MNQKKINTLKRQVEECDDTIRKAKKAKEDKKELEKQLKYFSKKMDLVRDNKIKWIEFDLFYYLYHHKDMNWNLHEEFYIYKTYHIPSDKTGYWKGLDELSDAEREHFDKYIKDYFYYGYPNSDGIHDASECEMAFEFGHSITRYKVIRECV